VTSAQVLTAEEMCAAENALFDTGTSVSQLMEIAAGGAAEWIRRVAAGRSVTVLCGPGNNGGDGYVIARRLREAGNVLRVVAPLEPATDAAREARARWGADVCMAGDGAHGEVFVDCLFGSGLTRPLSRENTALLGALAARHHIRVAVDLPSGIATDSGAVLNESLPDYNLTLALGAWKFAHWSLPGRLKMGQLRLVPLGVAEVRGAAQLVGKPHLAAPPSDSHKYRRGLLAVLAGAMPGAALLAAAAAQRAGAGYVKLFGDAGQGVPPELVQDGTSLRKALADKRIAAVLIGPGLGRDEAARERLAAALAASHPLILDGDALVLLSPGMLPQNEMILATPHDGELAALAHSFGVSAASRCEIASALARLSGMVIIAKGPDTLIAAPDGRLAVAPPASSWLSAAGTGDVLAGIAASRMSCGRDPFTAAREAVWLHAEAARRAGVAFTPSELAEKVSEALAAAL
jgi:ADP-dependent NAD(P)H-hydrate dehydratase / NAD(P)H-hydrate epimerase